ncbi:MAG: MBL fold metallo-hydrolase [Idiomarina sp.]|nr:MBL fold metallo-hydrolase [Idiomarina sp.]
MNQPIVQSFLDPDSETFSYVVHCPETGVAAIIDPVLDFDYAAGKTQTTQAQRLLDYIDAQGLSLAWILETHAHADHLSAAPFLREMTGAPIGIGEHIKDVQSVFKRLFNMDKEFLPNGAEFDRLFRDGEQFQIGQLTVTVMHTPGHTPADISYLVGDAVFVGDTLFMPDVGTARCDFPGGDSATLYQSIRKLLALPEHMKIYVCHDYPTPGREHKCQTTVAEQRASNKHVNQTVPQAEFVQLRNARDATLNMPRLIIPAIQVNIRAGQLPAAESNGTVYLKVPINLL